MHSDCPRKLLSGKVIELKVMRPVNLLHPIRAVMSAGRSGDLRLLLGNAGVCYADETMRITIEEILFIPKCLADSLTIGDKAVRSGKLLDDFLL